MQLTEDSTKLKLFMDVLDGAKAAVGYRIKTHFVCFDGWFNLKCPVSFS